MAINFYPNILVYINTHCLVCRSHQSIVKSHLCKEFHSIIVKDKKEPQKREIPIYVTYKKKGSYRCGETDKLFDVTHL